MASNHGVECATTEEAGKDHGVAQDVCAAGCAAFHNGGRVVGESAARARRRGPRRRHGRLRGRGAEKQSGDARDRPTRRAPARRRRCAAAAPASGRWPEDPRHAAARGGDALAPRELRRGRGLVIRGRRGGGDLWSMA
mmetsp:Transcript_16060/g.52339  ORF Transcript_16060/g.52339 Transcript_16060/m.52339 type:complete len:138 (-) Transcript_16060:702-1115(-)